jgi:hypothetical protein
LKFLFGIFRLFLASDECHLYPLLPMPGAQKGKTKGENAPLMLAACRPTRRLETRRRRAPGRRASMQYQFVHQLVHQPVQKEMVMNHTAAKHASRQDRYVSDFTRFMEAYLDQHPEVVADRKRGWGIWWERHVDLKEIERIEADTVPRSPYD